MVDEVPSLFLCGWCDKLIYAPDGYFVMHRGLTEHDLCLGSATHISSGLEVI